MRNVLGVVTSIWNKAFTEFIPCLGIIAMVYLEEHGDWSQYKGYEDPNFGNRIRLKRIKKHKDAQWKDLFIKNFAMINVSCKFSEKPPQVSSWNWSDRGHPSPLFSKMYFK
jgi:hypothetical protein